MLRTIQCIAILVWLTSVAPAQLVSGALIPVGANDGVGPLAARAVITEPIGAVFISGADGPDVLVRTGRFGIDHGLFLFLFSRRTEDGVPLFDQAVQVAYPFDGDYPPKGDAFEGDDGAVYAVWLDGKALVVTEFAREPYRFDETHRVSLDGLPRNPSAVTVVPDGDGYRVYFAVGDGTRYRPQGPGGRDPEYNPYDGRGIWRGGHPYSALYSARLDRALTGPLEDVRRVSPSDRDIRSNMGRLTPIQLGETERGVLAGSHFGNFHYYAVENGVESTKRQLVEQGREPIALRHPTIHPYPVAYPTRDGAWRSDVIAGGEGGLYWYRFTGSIAADARPVYEEAREVLVNDALLYAGTLPVPNVVDWDGDGDKDIVAGNSEGYILFIENVGSNATPRFAPGTRMEADGHTIHVQPGYRLDIQGPGEARWGYVCPTVVDWNGDRLLDIVMSDSTARHTYFKNVGTAMAPQLARGEPLYYDGLDLYGTWRVKPAAALMDGRMAYVALDDDDAFHLYWQQDSRNVTDGFKLRLDTGEVIQSNFIHAGGTGRLKLVLYDWDADGVKDLIVGTPRHGSVPNPKTGLPQSLGLPGSSVLFLRNTGTEAEPRFAFPKLFAFKGEPIHVGQHACGPAVADFGQPEGPGLILGEESGRFYYFSRDDLSLWSPSGDN